MTRTNNRSAKTVVAAALGECVHVAGVMKFIQLGLTDLSAHELTRYVKQGVLE